MFTKMRAIIAAERIRADEAEQRLAEYRQQVEEKRRRIEEEHRHHLVAGSRRREEEHRTRMRQNDEMHRAMLAALTEPTPVIAQLRQERSGNGR